MLTKLYKSLFPYASEENDIISLDGKVRKYSSRKESDIKEKVKPHNVLNAYSTNHDVCLASEVIARST